MEPRLRPVNAVLDLALADGLNPAPLAGAGWRVTCLEVPVVTELGTVVCDVVLFNETAGHLLVVEAKPGANIDPGQARKLSAIDPQTLIIAGGITVPRAVPLRREAMFACLAENTEGWMPSPRNPGQPAGGSSRPWRGSLHDDRADRVRQDVPDDGAHAAAADDLDRLDVLAGAQGQCLAGDQPGHPEPVKGRG